MHDITLHCVDGAVVLATDGEGYALVDRGGLVRWRDLRGGFGPLTQRMTAAGLTDSLVPVEDLPEPWGVFNDEAGLTFLQPPPTDAYVFLGLRMARHVDLVGVTEIARRLDLTEPQVYNLVSRSGWPAPVDTGSPRRWDWAAVERHYSARPSLEGLTGAEIAVVFEVDRGTAYNWIARRDFPSPLSNERPKRWDRDEVEQWAERVAATGRLASLDAWWEKRQTTP